LIRPGVPAPALCGRIGQEVREERHGVRYHALQTRSLMNRCTSPRVPFEWTVNPYRGCTMGCRYCYAAYTHDYLGRAGQGDFHSVVYAKEGGEGETLRGLVRSARRRELVALGTATDPYQPGERSFGTTRRFLEVAAGVRGLRLSITTKGALVLRDLDLLHRIHQRSSLTIAVSLISPDAELLRRIEPWAPPPDVRLEMVRRLVDAGIDAGVTIAPILPGLTDQERDLDVLVREIAAARACHVSWSLLFLRSPTREIWLEWLGREFPHRLAAYERAYARRSHLGGAYVARIRELMRRLCERHRVAVRLFPREKASPADDQLGLFG